jgi:hypothetical protein
LDFFMLLLVYDSVFDGVDDSIPGLDF